MFTSIEKRFNKLYPKAVIKKITKEENPTYVVYEVISTMHNVRFLINNLSIETINNLHN